MLSTERVEREYRLQVSKFGVAVSVVLLLALIVFSVLHVREVERFIHLLERTRPAWVVFAVGLQVGTYCSAGTVWKVVTARAGHRLKVTKLARLSVEKLTVDQFVPTGGVAGNVVVVRALHRAGVPMSVATEALLVDILGYYAAVACLTGAAVLVLWLHHGVTAVWIFVLAIFGMVAVFVPVTIHFLLKHPSFQLGTRLRRVKALSRLLETLHGVSRRGVENPEVLTSAAVLHLTIFVLDAATLWALSKAIGSPIEPMTTLVAIVMATIAGAASFLPGGVGSFEAACTATLVALGVRLEVALTSTLLLRGLTLWVPLLPGLALARRDVGPSVQQTGCATSFRARHRARIGLK